MHRYPWKPCKLLAGTRANPRPFYLLIIWLSASLFAVSCSRNGLLNQSASKGAQRPEVVLPYSGEMWLKWDRSSRLAFIMGNLRGYWDGQGAGCGEAKILAESLPGVRGLTEDIAEQMRFRCANKLKLSSRTFESYEGVVTEFYTRYPEERAVEIQDVLQLLAYDPDGKLTVSDVHERIKVFK